MDDTKVILQIKNGNKEMYRLLMEKYHNEIFTFIYNIVGQYQETEDVIQEVFLKVYNKLSKFNPEKASFRTWLYRVANNHTLNYIKKSSYKNRIVSEYDDYLVKSNEDIEESTIKEEQITKVISIMKKVLKPKHLEIMTLHYFSNLTVKEINEVTNIPEKTIYNALKSSIEKIKKEVE